MAAAARLLEGDTPCDGTRIGWARKVEQLRTRRLEFGLGAATTDLAPGQGIRLQCYKYPVVGSCCWH